MYDTDIVVNRRLSRSEGHRQHAEKFGEVRPCGLRVTRADRQTDRQTDILIIIGLLHTPSGKGGEITIKTRRKHVRRSLKERFHVPTRRETADTFSRDYDRLGSV